MKLHLAPAFLPICLVLGTFLGAACSDASQATPPAATAKQEPVKTPLVQKPEIADWCKEHGVPESVCTRCNASLVEQFQAKGDWCKQHGLPDSQCIACHPELKAKFEAMAPKTGG